VQHFLATHGLLLQLGRPQPILLYLHVLLLNRPPQQHVLTAPLVSLLQFSSQFTLSFQ
jgi:hypothetical protein